jgi:putative ABC transport system ATP-binding protein
MIEVKELSYTYLGQQPLIFRDFTCNKGEQWLLLGKSGSGKTTLLHLLGGLLTTQVGDVIIDGISINNLNKDELDYFRGKHIGFIFQKNHFVASLSVLENILLAQSLLGEKKDKDRAIALLDGLNILHKKNEKPYSLSQGEQQRVAIARALINQPKLILADEPTSALDDDNCNDVIQLLESQAKNFEATLLIVTHDTRLKGYFNQQITLS